MNLRDLQHIYFIGIGGIGMSALARLFHSRGIKVSGYDKTSSQLTDTLIHEGIDIHFDDDPARVPDDAGLVIYTPAIPATHKGLSLARELGLPVLKRSEVLGELSRGMFTAAIAGTHGKTSISSMLAHILADSGEAVTALVGGIMKNYDSNLVIRGEGNTFVVEADEYDRSFHRLSPGIALISAMDADHLDIYGNVEQMVKDFHQFASGIRDGGQLLLHHALDWNGVGDYSILRYGGKDHFRMLSMQAGPGYARLRFSLDGALTPEFDFHVPGRHNAENALGAAAVATLMGVGPEKIAHALSTYTGVVRRFDIRCQGPDFVYIDDYAHHPREIDVTIDAAREFFPGMLLTAVFQPHLFSRTRDFAEEFAASLDKVDHALLLEIYPARELPIPGVDSTMVSSLMKHPARILSPEEVLVAARSASEGVFLSIGAGDIDRLVQPLTDIFNTKQAGGRQG